MATANIGTIQKSEDLISNGCPHRRDLAGAYSGPGGCLTNSTEIDRAPSRPPSIVPVILSPSTTSVDFSNATVIPGPG